MTHSIGNNDIVHLGWAFPRRMPREDREKIVATSVESLMEAMEGPTHFQNSIDWSERDVVLYYCSRNTSSKKFGVDKIDQTAAIVRIACFSRPNTPGSSSFGQQIVILSVPKNSAAQIQFDHHDLNVFQEPEYKNIFTPSSYREAEERLLETRGPRNSKIDPYLRTGEKMTEEEMREQDWYYNLNSEEQALAVKKLRTYNAHKEFENAEYKSYETLFNRLMGKWLN